MLRENRYDEASGELVFTAEQVSAFQDATKRYADFFGTNSTKFGLIPEVITDPGRSTTGVTRRSRDLVLGLRRDVPARVNAVVLFRVVDPVKSVMSVENHAVATSQIAQTTLRSVVGRADLDTLLAHRADLNEDLAKSLAAMIEPWGVKVDVVEIKDVEIPEAMQRAMAREAEAERERRAKVINARGELQASAQLRDAAKTLSECPASLQLRYLQTLLEFGADHNSTVVFPLPIDIIGPFLDAIRGQAAPGVNGTSPASHAVERTHDDH
ncbi:SPFH domain-containing protein [Actinoplanes sp. ATCC 53533]|uniref:SPFH domain-containing protein n=1 Tax=Actinoplanes sp. ATCC 53533 TaxID=1288362 RepID=UPI0018F458B1|nr:SPFH domain-containing protein [Actinoplanes sp. ATCC 53533]